MPLLLSSLLPIFRLPSFPWPHRSTKLHSPLQHSHTTCDLLLSSLLFPFFHFSSFLYFHLALYSLCCPHPFICPSLPPSLLSPSSFSSSALSSCVYLFPTSLSPPLTFYLALLFPLHLPLYQPCFSSMSSPTLISLFKFVSSIHLSLSLTSNIQFPLRFLQFHIP